MEIIRKIPVKQVLTEASKEKMQHQFHREWKQLDQECQQLSFEKRRIESKQNVSREEVSKRFQKELDRRKEKMRWVEYQLEQLDILPLGSELTDSEVETVVTVEIGSNWEDIMSEGAIVVEDGKVIRIDR
ncbi:hypothetical protein N781_12330 [Pontibacillus halophilus JSM 076056 = DSM 19796]|uniref:YlqD protein n=1 Tax=Pontibacillus halophilus JSM 076056 = DSM 19796 TaxID=1385510 RepID=A0A0A5GPU8_9BACI|nr:YlqD family protein [Pontibacillus halophilus]KGX93190.1 hypothetical protein N781_12330 [Pontibacillus halophilus JSM 076056 = DSM 19796]